MPASDERATRLARRRSRRCLPRSSRASRRIPRAGHSRPHTVSRCPRQARRVRRSPIARAADTLRAMRWRSALVRGGAGGAGRDSVRAGRAARLHLRRLRADRGPRAAALASSEIARVFAERHWPTLPYYRPIARASMLAQKALHGNEPAPYHVLNVALVAAIALAAFALLRTGALALPLPLAFAGAALFALHPVASSCVYPIASGRETLWPTLFELLAVMRLAAAGRALLRARARRVRGGAALEGARGGAARAVRARGRARNLGATRRAGAPRRVAAPLRAARAAPARATSRCAGWIFAGEGDARARAAIPRGRCSRSRTRCRCVFAPTRELVYEPVVVGLALALAARSRAGRERGDLSSRSSDAIGPRGVARCSGWAGSRSVCCRPRTCCVQDARFDERYVFFASLGVVGARARRRSSRSGAARPRARRSACVLVRAIAGAALISVAARAVLRLRRGLPRALDRERPEPRAAAHLARQARGARARLRRPRSITSTPRSSARPTCRTR